MFDLTRTLTRWTLGSLFFGATAACSATLAPGEYPKVALQVSTFHTQVVDPRAVASLVPSGNAESSAQASFKLPFPSQEFTRKADQRLQQLTHAEGTALNARVTVKRSEITFTQSIDGNLVRWNVTLGIEVVAPGGVTLSHGTVSAWREVSEHDTTEVERGAAYLEASLAAFDSYFGAESALESLRIDLDSYSKSHPK